MKTIRWFAPALVVAVAILAAATTPVLADSVGLIRSVVNSMFGGPINGSGATAGQAIVKQADGSWKPGTISTTKTLQQAYTDGGAGPQQIQETTSGQGILVQNNALNNNYVIEIDKLPASGSNSGGAFSINMNGSTTGNAISIDMGTGTGLPLSVTANSVAVFSVDNTGKVTAGATTVTAFKPNCKTLTSVDSPYTVASTDYTLLCNCTGGAITVNLPAVSTNRNRVVVVKAIVVSGGSVTIARNGSDTIDGATSLTESVRYTSYTLQAPDSGADWAVE